MSFIKTGDNMPIQSIYDDDGEKCVCPKCGKAMRTIFIDDTGNTLVCQGCDIGDSE